MTYHTSWACQHDVQHTAWIEQLPHNYQKQIQCIYCSVTLICKRENLEENISNSEDNDINVTFGKGVRVWKLKMGRSFS